MSNKIMLYTTEPKSFVQEELEKYAKEAKLEFDVVNPMECAVLQTEKETAFLVKGEPLSDYVACIPRMSETELDYKVLSMRHFEKAKIKMLNSGDSMRAASNKVDMQVALNSVGIKTPKSIMLNDKDQLDAAVKWFDEKFPMIVKTVFGTHGVGVIKADSLSSLRSIIQQLIKTEDSFLIQEFLEHDKAYRLLVLDGEVLGGVARTTAANDFRTNAHQGSEVTEHKPSDNEIEICLKAAKAIDIKLAAVDYIIQGEGENATVIVLEINGSPGFESMQEVVKEPIAKKIIDYVVSTLIGGQDSAPEEEEEVKSEITNGDEKKNDEPVIKDEPATKDEKDEDDHKIIEPEKEKIKADDFELVGSVDSVVVKYFNDEKPIHARVDTGAEYSSINGKDIKIDDETISFVFGEFRYRFSLVKSIKIVAANGVERRPTIRLDVIINNSLIRNVEFTVNDRGNLNYDILLGRRALAQANVLVNPAFIKIDTPNIDQTGEDKPEKDKSEKSTEEE